MFTRYVTAVSTGTAMTFALLFVMQLLITLQPGAESVLRPRIPIDWINWEPLESPVATRDESITKEKLIDVDPTPARPKTNGGLEPLLINTVGPTPPAPTGLASLGVFTDGPLVALVRVAPVYPTKALTYGVEGYVVVQFDVTAEGEVVNAVIRQRSASNLSPVSLMDWRWKATAFKTCSDLAWTIRK